MFFVKMALVKDVMSRKVVSVSVDETVFSAVNRMRDNAVSSLVVFRGRNPLGMITEQDMVRRVLCERRDPEKTFVREIMSTPLITVSPLASLEEAADAFRRGRVKKLAVVSGGVLEGIVSVTDILAAETKEMKVVSGYVELLSR